ncbi:MAG: methylated-DNA--[protein]-cysteine S-methyltransferase [Clostridium sp.]
MMKNYSCRLSSPIGDIRVAGDGTSLTGLCIAQQKYFPKEPGDEIAWNNLPLFVQTKEWLDCYFSGKEPEFMPPLSPQGTPFRREVWKLLCEIPYGQLTTYGRLAEKLGEHMSAQAVGGAVGHNPISIMIPCHRVVGADGNLTGYGGGICLKVKLLELEHVPMDNLYMPGRKMV